MKNCSNFRLLFMGLTILLLLTVISGIVFGSSADWSEVTRFTGSGTTDYFTCEHVEWRFRWEYDASQYSVFSIFVYEQGEDVFFIDSVFKSGTEETSGISYIHDHEGIFYMDIGAANIENFTVIVEQDLNSIPEFPSWIILPLFLIATLLALIFRRRMR